MNRSTSSIRQPPDTWSDKHGLKPACYMALCSPTYGPAYGPIYQSDILPDSRTRYTADMNGRPSLVYIAAYQAAYRGSSGRARIWSPMWAVAPL